MIAHGTASVPIRDQLLEDHAQLERLFERLLAAFAANDREEVARLWTEFELGLLGHMKAEEADLIPMLEHASPRNARVVIQEHRHIRSRLAELGVAVDLHTLRLETARAFIDELRAHARNEDRILYQWAEERVGPAEQLSLFESLAARLRARAKRVESAADS
ncbi:MAG TPA: hemerythrin domain-containing protein [Labilithrix sp.]|jgi:hemerythrin-like domain-containing protein|nr:hemerythrin domain-containing protein [Labilithrix sp.]